MPDVRLAEDSVHFHAGYSRTPTTMPITFTPGTPEGIPA
jgi:hypothetical protein